MSDDTFFSNLPEVMMTKHRLTEGAVEIHEDTGKVVIELWNGRSSTMNLRGREDAAVLRYVANALESFADDFPQEEDGEEQEAENNLTKSQPNVDQGSDKKQPQIVVGGSAALNEFALK